MTAASGAADFDVANDGTLVYVASVPMDARMLVWVDRQAHEVPIRAPARAYVYPRISPDGSRVALDIRDQASDIWIWHFASETLTPFTQDPAADRLAIWAQEGRRLVFSSTRRGGGNLFWQLADGTGTAEPLTQGSTLHMANSVSPDGHLVFSDFAETTELKMLALNDDGRTPQTLFRGRYAEVSPDGKWVAFESNVSGRNENPRSAVSRRGRRTRLASLDHGRDAGSLGS